VSTTEGEVDTGALIAAGDKTTSEDDIRVFLGDLSIEAAMSESRT
jgi:hypothetical protein